MNEPKAAQPTPPPDPAPASTAVTVGNADDAKVFDEAMEGDLGGVGELPRDAQSRLALQRAQFRERLAMEKNERAFVAAASKVTWARSLAPEALLKLAGWAREKDLDLLLEFNILGGTAGYVNSRWYIRQLGHLVADGIVEYAYYDVVNKDPRLDAIAEGAIQESAATMKLPPSDDPEEMDRRRQVTRQAAERGVWARGEIRRREAERVRYGLPEDATASVVWHVKLDRMAQEVTAAQSVGNYRGKREKSAGPNVPPGAKAEEVFKDPVGEEFPRETAITRGCRKVMLALAHVAPRLKAKVEMAEAAARQIALQAPDLAAEGRAELRRLHGVPVVKHVTSEEYSDEPRSVPTTANRSTD